ncbi:uncharacterized protein LOC126934321 [Macaca thibetana thibetana]|uniref:uncharacterized protein LOC126934321 n=1 Tax=Macaca thibetana thibetana TaxID=257877 RepID=UPI0021BC8FD8|nr:uncharacterized protein LOC126934321 [Macaca thibetana thibetana]
MRVWRESQPALPTLTNHKSILKAAQQAGCFFGRHMLPVSKISISYHPSPYVSSISSPILTLRITISYHPSPYVSSISSPILTLRITISYHPSPYVSSISSPILTLRITISYHPSPYVSSISSPILTLRITISYHPSPYVSSISSPILTLRITISYHPSPYVSSISSPILTLRITISYHPSPYVSSISSPILTLRLLPTSLGRQKPWRKTSPSPHPTPTHLPAPGADVCTPACSVAELCLLPAKANLPLAVGPDPSRLLRQVVPASLPFFPHHLVLSSVSFPSSHRHTVESGILSHIKYRQTL